MKNSLSLVIAGIILLSIFKIIQKSNNNNNNPYSPFAHSLFRNSRFLMIVSILHLILFKYYNLQIFLPPYYHLTVTLTNSITIFNPSYNRMNTTLLYSILHCTTQYSAPLFIRYLLIINPYHMIS